MIRVVPATSELLEGFYGAPVSKSVRALAAIDGSRVVGVAGVYVDDAKQVVFSSFTDELRAKPLALLRGWRQMKKWLAQSALPAYAVCDRTIEGAERFLTHLGFRRVEGDIYQWLN